MFLKKSLGLGLVMGLLGCGSLDDEPSQNDRSKPVNYVDTETDYQEDYQLADDHGELFNPTAPVAMDDQYRMFPDDVAGADGLRSRGQGYGFQPHSRGYDRQVNRHLNEFRRPYGRYAAFGRSGDGRYERRPYLMDRYRTHRSFLNYSPGYDRLGGRYRDVGWRSSQYRDYGRSFDRSRRWVNYDLYNLIYRTLDSADRCGYRSHDGLERRIRQAIQRRDHFQATRLHDELLRRTQGRRSVTGSHRR